MMLHRLHGVFFMLLGAVSVVDGWRIAQQAREGANFDAIGPDRYLMALGALMLAAGFWGLLSRPELHAAPQAAILEPDEGAISKLVLTLAMLVAFAVLVPVLGFSLTCFLFLAAQLCVLSGWPWWLSIGVAVAIALAFDVAFIRLADMSLPKGYIWD
jgi:putative tricarboxylic transport membrane protein